MTLDNLITLITAGFTKEEILIYLKELSKEAFKAEHFVL